MSYKASSPYYATGVVDNKFLDVMVDRPIPMDASDVLWEITSTYNQRPDLLAYDLYGDPGFWWVFASRNPNRLLDPLFDFVPGTTIYLPKVEAIRQALG